MKETPDLAFEAIHLVSTLLSRFNAICSECKLVEEELYALAYIKYQGMDHKASKHKALHRQDVTKLLKKVFGSKDQQISKWVGNLCSRRYLGEDRLGESQQTVMASSKHGTKVLVLTPKGEAKVAEFIRALENIRSEVLEKDYLIVPGMDKPGLFGSNIIKFLQFALANRNLLGLNEAVARDRDAIAAQES